MNNSHTNGQYGYHSIQSSGHAPSGGGSGGMLSSLNSGGGMHNSQSSNSSANAAVMIQQLQMMEQQTMAKLRDFETLAQLPPEQQRAVAAQLRLDQASLQPQVLANQIGQLRSVVEQYKVQIMQVQLRQQQLQQQQHHQQQQQHHQQQQQQQQHAGSVMRQHHAAHAQVQAAQARAAQAQAQAQAQQAQAQQARAHAHMHHPQQHPMQQHQMHRSMQQPGANYAQPQHLRPLPPGCAAGTERLGSLNQPAMMQSPYMSSHAAGAFTTGDRLRLATTNSRKRAKRDESPDNDPSLRSSPGDDMKKTRGSLRSRSKVNYAEAEAFAEITDDDAPEANSDEERKQKQKNAVAAFDDTSELDDEVEKVLAHRDSETIAYDPTDKYANQEFYVKWRHWSHIHNSWDTRDTLYQLAGYKRVKNYIKRMEDLDRKRRILTREEIELIDVERQMEYEMSLQHQVIERIVAERTDGKTEKKYLCKWQGLPYGENTWELVEDVIKHGGQNQVDEYLRREQRIMLPPQSVDMARRMFLQRHRALQEQPGFLKGGQLRDYQLQSLNWMIYGWLNNTNIILADEMGLGKTVQCASLIGYFSEVLNIYGPFLIVVPLSTVPNWIREFRKWIPSVNAVVYVGDTKSREVIREFEFLNKRRSDRELKFEALITTYELVLKDSEVLSQIRWSFLVVDEAHRLKNNESALYRELQTWTFRNKLLVTGTPLQNSVKELWALLHFLEPYRFPSCEDFELRYDLRNPESVSQLHQDLKPHLLRRIIKDVERSLPPKNERILRVDMTPLQRQYYKWVLTRNFKELNKGSKGQVTLLNIISDLKKCCNHPFLFESAEEEYKGRGDENSQIDRLVRTSGKMVLLDKLLTRLKPAGHRVLLFSQMVHMLDIISDYMRLRGWQHQRLDGSTPSQQRHQAMEHFNAEGSQDFAFLLSTRAGGLGINLATADTVIIFDSDWNPQNDLQAMSRAHRIGQKSHVNIYRFVTMGSVEQDILERAKRKMVLDHVIIQRMDTSGRTVLEGGKAGKDMFDKGELAAILRFGAENLFEEDAGDDKVKEDVQKRDQQLYEEDIDAILARAEVVDQRVEEEANDKKNDLLSAFNSVATFKNDEDDATFWNRLITDDQRATVPERKGTKATVTEVGPDGELMPRTARLRAAGSGADDKGRKARNRAAVEAAAPVVTIEVNSWPPLCNAEGEFAESSDTAWDGSDGLPRRDANAFVRGMRRYARIDKLDDICADAGGLLADTPPEARYALWYGVEGACRDALAAVEVQGLDPKDAQVDFFGASIKALEFSQQISAMRLLSAEVAQLSEPYTMFRIDEDTLLAPPKWAPSNGWAVQDDAMLLLGSQIHGIGFWERIAADEQLGLRDKLAGAVKDGAKVGDKNFPQGSHLETRVIALLKRIERSRNPNAIQIRPGRKSKKGGSLPPVTEKKPRRAASNKRRRTKSDPELHKATCSSALEAVMPELKKLRLMSRKKDIPEARVQSKTRKYMLTIGDKIASLPRDDGLPNMDELWEFVAEFTENDSDGVVLASMYETLDAKRAHGSAAGVEVERPEEIEPEEEEDVLAGDSASAEADAEVAAEAAALAAAAEYDDGYEPEADPDEEEDDEPEDDDDEWKAD